MLRRTEGADGLEAPAFAVTSERTDAEEHIRVVGEMDLAVTRDLDRAVRRAEENGASRIVLDISQLEFLDVAGVRLLLDLNARSDADGCRLCMIGASSPHVRRILEVTGAAAVLPLLT